MEIVEMLHLNARDVPICEKIFLCVLGVANMDSTIRECPPI